MKKLLMALSLIVLISGCTNMTIEKGDFVSLEYTGTLDDGTVFDSNVGKDALNFTAGAGQMIAGFDAAVIGMKVGEEKTFTLSPSEAYGESNPELIQHINRTELVKAIGTEPEIGMVLSTAQGYSGTINEMNDTMVTIDFNHELAGKSLTFKIKILDIKKQ